MAGREIVGGFESDRQYFQRRAEEEVKLAQQATHVAAVAAHYALAELYLEKAGGPEDGSHADKDAERSADG